MRFLAAIGKLSAPIGQEPVTIICGRLGIDELGYVLTTIYAGIGVP